jgi:hypothetical protein
LSTLYLKNLVGELLDIKMELITKKDWAILKIKLIKEFKSALQNKSEEKNERIKTWK